MYARARACLPARARACLPNGRGISTVRRGSLRASGLPLLNVSQPQGDERRQEGTLWRELPCRLRCNSLNGRVLQSTGTMVVQVNAFLFGVCLACSLRRIAGVRPSGMQTAQRDLGILCGFEIRAVRTSRTLQPHTICRDTTRRGCCRHAPLPDPKDIFGVSI